jgi:hypothetical protein
MHEENSNGERKVVRKIDRAEFGEVIYCMKRSKPIIYQPTMDGSL